MRGSAASAATLPTRGPRHGPYDMSVQRFVTNLMFASTPPEEKIIEEVSAYLEHQQGKMQEQLSCLKRQLEVERRAHRKLKSMQTAEVSTKSELENFFFQCVEELKREVSKRRTYSENLLLKKNSTGLKKRPVGYDSLTKTDKIKALEMLVSNDEVLLTVYDKVFGGMRSQEQQTARLYTPNNGGEPLFFLSPNSSELQKGFELGHGSVAIDSAVGGAPPVPAPDSKYEQLMSQPLDKLLGITPAVRSSEKTGLTVFEKHLENS